MTPPTATDDRPRYRVLTTSWRDDATDDATGSVTGHELTIYRVDEHWRRVAGSYEHEPLGVTQVTGDALDVAAARAAVVDWLHAHAAPRPCRAVPDDVAVFAELTTESEEVLE